MIRRRVDCPWCHRDIAINRNGELWPHTRFSGLGRRVSCGGSGRTPEAAAAALDALRDELAASL